MSVIVASRCSIDHNECNPCIGMAWNTAGARWLVAGGLWRRDGGIRVENGKVTITPCLGACTTTQRERERERESSTALLTANQVTTPMLDGYVSVDDGKGGERKATFGLYGAPDIRCRGRDADEGQ